jgi:hypothetical protein
VTNVPGVREWLDRFRPAGAPGAATATGVPFDRREAARAELEPVFAALADDINRAARTRDAMTEQASRRRAEGRVAARALIADALSSEQAERRAEEARLSQVVLAQTQARREQASIQVQEVRDRATQRRPAVLSEIVARVRADIDELGRRAGPGAVP